MPPYDPTPGRATDRGSMEADPGHRRRRLPRLASVRAPARPTGTTCSASTTSSPAPSATSSTCSTIPASSCCATTSPSRCTSRSTRSTTSPARRRRSTTSTTRCRRPRPACTARSTCWAWPSGCARKILQASTSEVYGDPDGPSAARGLLGQRQPDRPAQLLRRGQALRRDAVLRLPPPARRATSGWRASSTPTARACIPNDGRVVSNFIVQALRGEPITIYGDGTQTRCFCYVDDLVDGLVRLMDTPDDVTGPINIGNPGEFTMLELARQVIAADRFASRSSCSSRCRPTIRSSAGPTSAWRAGAARLGADRAAGRGPASRRSTISAALLRDQRGE